MIAFGENLASRPLQIDGVETGVREVPGRVDFVGDAWPRDTFRSTGWSLEFGHGRGRFSIVFAGNLAPRPLEIDGVELGLREVPEGSIFDPFSVPEWTCKST